MDQYYVVVVVPDNDGVIFTSVAGQVLNAGRLSEKRRRGKAKAQVTPRTHWDREVNALNQPAQNCRSVTGGFFVTVPEDSLFEKIGRIVAVLFAADVALPCL